MIGARGRKSKRRIGVDLFQFLILSGAIADSECLTMFILSLLSSKDKNIEKLRDTCGGGIGRRYEGSSG